MGDALIGWQNAILTATLAPSSAATGMGAAQLKNQHGSPVYAWQTVGAVTTANLLIDAGTSASWRIFSLHRTNLTSGATVRWRVSEASDMSAPTYDSGVVSGTVFSGYGQSIVVAPSVAAGRYARLDVVDSGNPDAFLNIPLAYAGPAHPTSVGLTAGTRNGRDRDEVVSRSRGGQEYVTLRSVRRRWNFEFGLITTPEYWQVMDALDRASISGMNILLAPFSSGEYLAREAIFGRLALSEDATWPVVGGVGFRRYAGVITERI